MFDLSEKDLVRFWQKVDVRGEEECWPWMGARVNEGGYGSFTVANGKPGGKKIVASRISCFLAHGAPPQDWNRSLHSCDNPPCCNPNHLRWGTQKHNVADAKKRNRHVNPPVLKDNPEWEAKRVAAMPKGEAVHNQTLTEEAAREIMRLHMTHQNITQIAEAVGKPKHVVADVCRGRSWRHLDNIPSIEDLKRGGVRRGFNQFSSPS